MSEHIRITKNRREFIQDAFCGFGTIAMALTSGGAAPWAICLDCNRRHGRSLRRGWLTVFGWLAKPMLLLFGLYALLYWLFGS